MKNIPESFDSERLIIRSVLPTDAPVIHEAITESLETLQRWIPWSKPAPTLEEVEKTCRRMYANFITQEDLALAIFLKDGMYVGGTGLHRINWAVPKFEIGYWCRQQATGKGYITEAAAATTRFAFDILEAKRVEIRMDEQNLKSKAVPERLGFNLDGRLINDDRNMAGALRTTLIYAKTT